MDVTSAHRCEGALPFPGFGKGGDSVLYAGENENATASLVGYVVHAGVCASADERAENYGGEDQAARTACAVGRGRP
jgi:hypothetical protein